MRKKNRPLIAGQEKSPERLWKKQKRFQEEFHSYMQLVRLMLCDRRGNIQSFEYLMDYYLTQN